MPDVSLFCILPFGKENMFWLIFFCRHQHENGNGPNVLSKIFNVIAANTAGSYRDRYKYPVIYMLYVYMFKTAGPCQKYPEYSCS